MPRVGYNIIAGDPHADLDDPGWAGRIFDQEWIMANGEGFPYKACTYVATVSSISGGGSAQASLSKTTKISASAGGWGAKVAFTGSESVNTMNKSAWSDAKHVEQASATCVVYRARLPDSLGVPFKFTRGFKARVRRLPTAKGASADTTLNAWMTEFGTHFSQEITMGGMYTRRWTMSESSWSTYQEDAKTNGYSIEAGVEGEFSASTEVSGEKDEKAMKAFKTATSEKSAKVFYLGGTPFVKGDSDKWAEGLKDALAPVFAGSHNVLTPITELLTDVNFPGLDPDVLATAEEFAQRLCTPDGPNLGYRNCTRHPVDPPNIRIIPAISITTGSGITSVAWVRDGGSVTTGSAHGFVRTWDVLTGIPRNPLYGSSIDIVASVVYSPDQTQLAAGFLVQEDNADVVRISDTAGGGVDRVLVGTGGSVAYSPDGKYLAAVERGESESNTAVIIWNLKAELDRLHQVPSIKLMASASSSYSGWPSDCCNILTKIVTSMAYSPDGSSIVQSSKVMREWPDASYAGGYFTDRDTIYEVNIWNPVKAEITLELKWLERRPLLAINSLAYSPSGLYVAAGCDGGSVEIWDTVTGDHLKTLSTTEDVYSVTYGLDDQHLASGSRNGEVVIWSNVRATSPSSRIIGDATGIVNSVAYSPDGRYIASGRTDSDSKGSSGSLTINPVGID